MYFWFHSVIISSVTDSDAAVSRRDVDSTRCRNSNNISRLSETPPVKASGLRWKENEGVRVTSVPQEDASHPGDTSLCTGNTAGISIIDGTGSKTYTHAYLTIHETAGLFGQEGYLATKKSTVQRRLLVQAASERICMRR